MTKEEFEEQKKIVMDFMEDAYKKSKDHRFRPEEWQSIEWQKIKDPENTYTAKMKDTGVPIERVKQLGLQISKLPPNYNFHPQIAKIFNHRVETIEQGHGIDWGTAEALAFATLIDEGFHIRISGQDVERGTFSHRHAILHD